jgi:hypothetical protein
MHNISRGYGLVYIRQTEGSIGSKVKEHHHLDIPAVTFITSNSRKPESPPGNPDIIRKVTYGATSQQAAQQERPHCEQDGSLSSAPSTDRK